MKRLLLIGLLIMCFSKNSKAQSQVMILDEGNTFVIQQKGIGIAAVWDTGKWTIKDSTLALEGIRVCFMQTMDDFDKAADKLMKAEEVLRYISNAGVITDKQKFLKALRIYKSLNN